MSLSASDLKDLQAAVADRLYLQINGWHLYLGDAGLAETLAIECSALLDQGPAVCARRALAAGQGPNGAGRSRLPLARLLPSSQLSELEQILEDHCR